MKYNGQGEPHVHGLPKELLHSFFTRLMGLGFLKRNTTYQMFYRAAGMRLVRQRRTL